MPIGPNFVQIQVDASVARSRGLAQGCFKAANGERRTIQSGLNARLFRREASPPNSSGALQFIKSKELAVCGSAESSPAGASFRRLAFWIGGYPDGYSS